MNWVELSGRATVFSYSIVRGFPGLPDIVLVPVVVDLPDAPGARLVSNVIDVDPADVCIGMELQVVFSPVRDGWLLPIFRPVENGHVART
ncbi:Zn-ribbon domain-containing OB-fold protein [Streptosporangium sp. 'caverna']|uniref:Zn-ribbon domain-containing OB-fold protein n=1 Tax=Streptosporangium sp. 'caverna' TaxID=2202249 RepID=UPI003512BDA6